MLKMIEVTQDCINEGWQGSACNCPISLAIHNAIPKLQKVGTTREWSSLYSDKPGNHNFRVIHGNAVTKFVDQFDDGVAVAPFSFEIEVPDAFLEGLANG